MFPGLSNIFEFRYNLDVPDKTLNHLILEWKLAVMNEGLIDEPAFKTQFNSIQRKNMICQSYQWMSGIRKMVLKESAKTVNRIENSLSTIRYANEAYEAFIK